MVTEDNKEAIRERLLAGLAELEAKLTDSEKEFMRDALREAIDKNKALLQELDALAALGTATLRDLDLATKDRISVISHRANVDELMARSVAASEKQANALALIAELVAKEAAKGEKI